MVSAEAVSLGAADAAIMRALVLVLLAATPLAAAASFIAIPAPSEHGAPCGREACFALGAGDAAVRIQGGRTYAFFGDDGLPIVSGSICGTTMLVVPAGATMLRIDPALCA